MTPVLIVSGFLGSGKTTLVRRLLAHAQAAGLRVAVVSNEFGALGIDEALLGDGEERFVELAGGCVCCRLSDELVDTLQALYERVRPDRIVIETSGVALPFETQLNLYRPPVSAWVGDEAAVVVVDAEQLLDGSEVDGTFTDQVSSADLLVLHKIDLVPADALPALEARLRALAPDAPILRAVHGDVDPDVLFPVGPVAPHARPRTDAHRPHTHEHFRSSELVIPAGSSEEDVLARLRVEADGALRVKGFVRTDAGPRVVQGVGRRLDLAPLGDARIPDGAEGRVVVIRRA